MVDRLSYMRNIVIMIGFDTTYRTNRYNMPFAPFVGVTGHGSTCLFGCAFLGDETAETFKWVFETFITEWEETSQDYNYRSR